MRIPDRKLIGGAVAQGTSILDILDGWAKRGTVITSSEKQTILDTPERRYSLQTHLISKAEIQPLVVTIVTDVWYLPDEVIIYFQVCTFNETLVKGTLRRAFEKIVGLVGINPAITHWKLPRGNDAFVLVWREDE